MDEQISFTEYKNWIEKYICNNDTREINFQNDVIKRLIERLFPHYDVVNVGTKGSDSRKHNYYKSDCQKCPTQIENHLYAEKIDKVIYTDSFVWRFYKRDNLDKPTQFCFVNKKMSEEVVHLNGRHMIKRKKYLIN